MEFKYVKGQGFTCNVASSYLGIAWEKGDEGETVEMQHHSTYGEIYLLKKRSGSTWWVEEASLRTAFISKGKFVIKTQFLGGYQG